MPYESFTEVPTSVTIAKKNMLKEPTIAIYPNPSTGSFYINNTIKLTNVEVHNYMGQLVYKGNNHHINLSNETKGLYMVTVKTENNNISTSKLIIQ